MPLTHQEWISLLLRNRVSIKGVSLGLLFNDVTYEQKQRKKKKRKEKPTQTHPSPQISSLQLSTYYQHVFLSSAFPFI